MAATLNPRSLKRPIRVVVFGGAYFEPVALRFLVALHENAEIDLVGMLCQSAGDGVAHRVLDVLKRRRAAALPVLAYEAARSLSGVVWHPLEAMRFRRASRVVLRMIERFADIHAPEVVARVRELVPDLGVLYGGPILRTELFDLPAFGTLGIHHGKLPEYRGKKTTFWAMINGEATAGVTIQKINTGLDTGEIVREGEISIGTKGYRKVEWEVEALGAQLYIDAILAVKRGEALLQPARSGRFPLYRQPTPRDIVRYVRMRAAVSRQLSRTRA
jgi:methionyl-tRNA formyltransferase